MAFLTFDSIREITLSDTQQTKVTDWLNGTHSMSDKNDYSVPSTSLETKQTVLTQSVATSQKSDLHPDIISWLRPIADRDKISAGSLCSNSTTTHSTSESLLCKSVLDSIE
jgi:hypothetical protein